MSRLSYIYERNYKTDFTALLLPTIRFLHTWARNVSACVQYTRENVTLQIRPDRIHETREEMSKSSFTAPTEQSYYCRRDSCTGPITFNVILNSTIY